MTKGPMVESPRADTRGGGNGADAPQILVRIVGGSEEFRATVRQLTAGATVEATLVRLPDGWPESPVPARLRPELYVRRLPVAELGGRRIRYLKVETILCIEAENQYLRLHVRDRSFLVRDAAMTIRGLERRLDPQRFVRISRSHIVNLEWVVAVQTESSCRRVLLASGHQFAVSTTRWEGLKRALAGPD